MKSREILRRLVRRFGLLLLLALVGGAAGATYAALKTPTYTAKAYVVAIGEPGESITALNFAQAYGRIATSGPVLAQAAARLGGDAGGLSSVTAETSPDAPVVEITATGTSARATTDRANAVAGALTEYGSLRRSDTKVSLSMLAPATVPERPTSPKPPLELAVGAAGGLLIGGLAVLAGVGRSATVAERVEEQQEETRAEPARYEAEVPEVEDAEEDEPAADGGRFTGIALVQRPSKAITAYRASSLDAPLGEDAADRVIPAQRVVGRATVAGMEDE
ncbi:Wzz/FepE/Etk N-terminal domain-containing protein [Actinoplanes sp. NPDC049548]|uniref:Wzz/FepE/Etk N-terminal domain-containing protein n=1 Tax=Actinoplanes sp. NPDC049548 TaxID=3155152 RepID=UPI0034486F9F